MHVASHFVSVLSACRFMLLVVVFRLASMSCFLASLVFIHVVGRSRISLYVHVVLGHSVFSEDGIALDDYLVLRQWLWVCVRGDRISYSNDAFSP